MSATRDAWLEDRLPCEGCGHFRDEHSDDGRSCDTTVARLVTNVWYEIDEYTDGPCTCNGYTS